MTARRWIARSIIAGTSGSMVHFLFMYFKSATGLLPQFQPYHSFQVALSDWLGTNVPHIVPWVLSFLNGMTILSLLFARIHRLLPGRMVSRKAQHSVLSDGYLWAWCSSR